MWLVFKKVQLCAQNDQHNNMQRLLQFIALAAFSAVWDVCALDLTPWTDKGVFRLAMFRMALMYFVIYLLAFLPVWLFFALLRSVLKFFFGQRYHNH